VSDLQPDTNLRLLDSPEPNKDMVEGLRSLLALAEKGEVLTAAWVFETRTKLGERVFVFTNDDRTRMVGMLETAKHSVLGMLAR
jgi:hypothetical protein